MTNPRFGFDNLLDRFKDGVIAIGETEDGPAVNAFDWRPGSLWKTPIDRNIAGNNDFLLFTAGPALEPDGYVLVGAGASVLKVVDATLQALPNYVEITRSGADTSLLQSIPNLIEVFAGRKYGIKMRCRTSTAGMLEAQIDDGTTFATSLTHTGSGAFQILTATLTVGPGATNLNFGAILTGVDGVADIDWIMVEELNFQQTVATNFGEVSEAALYVFCAENQLLRNWLMDRWDAGGEALPDRYVAQSGAPTSVLRSQDAKLGRYAMELDGAGFIVGQEIVGDELASLIGSKTWTGHWCKSSDVRARVAFCYRFRDGTLSGEIAGIPGAGGRVHTGGGAYEWLATSIDVPYGITGLFACVVQAAGGDFTATWDAGLLTRSIGISSGLEPDELPHPQFANYLAYTTHNVESSDQQLTFEGSPNNFVGAVGILVSVPAGDTTRWDDVEPPFSTTHGAFRVKTTNINPPQTRPIEIGVISFGEYLEMPCAPLAPFAILNERFQSEIPKTRFGAPLGRSIPRIFKTFSMRFQILTKDFVKTELFAKFWAHVGATVGKPMFLQWNDAVVPRDETFFVFLPDAAQFNPQLHAGNQIREFEIEFEALAR